MSKKPDPVEVAVFWLVVAVFIGVIISLIVAVIKSAKYAAPL